MWATQRTIIIIRRITIIRRRTIVKIIRIIYTIHITVWYVMILFWQLVFFRQRSSGSCLKVCLIEVFLYVPYIQSYLFLFWHPKTFLSFFYFSRSLGMTASILHDTSGESSSFCANTIKLENSGAYYCNSYASPIPSAPPPCIVSVGSINERSPNSSSMVVSSANSEWTIKGDLIFYSWKKLTRDFLTDFDFPVILRPGGEQVSNPGHDSLSLQRYSLHPATRFVAVSQARPDEGKLNSKSR